MQFKSFTCAVLPLLLDLVSGTPNNRVFKGLKVHTGPSSAANFSRNVYSTTFENVTWDEDNWLLSTTILDQGHYQSRGNIANGYIGINVASVGPFFEIDSPEDINGWPLYSKRQSFATVSGFFDSQPDVNGSNFPWLSQYGYDSAISGVPHWAGIVLDLGDDTYLDAKVDNETISDFRTTYDYKSGVLVWSYKWTPEGDKGSFQITYRLFAHKLYINQAVVDLEIVPSKESKASIVNVLDGACAVRTDFVESGQDNGAIFSAVRPNGIANVTAYVYANITGSPDVDLASRKIVSNKPYVHSNESSIAQAVDVNLKPGQSVRVTKFVGIASTDAFEDPQQTAKEAASTAMKNGRVQSLRTHIMEWASVMPEDSVDNYASQNGTLPKDSHIIDSAVNAVVSTYYLLQNTVGKNAIKEASGAPVNKDSISVGGLTSDSYAGQVFWDADVWMQPGLVASHPEASQRFTNFRVAQHDQARENVKTAFTGSKNQTEFSPSAAIFPWTSGRYGNCTATGACWDYQYHLNGDIGISLVNQWVTSGNTKVFKEEHFPVYDAAATLYSNLLARNGSSWTLTNMTDPDEYANHVDAGGYTMPLIAETLRQANSFRKQFGLEENSTWEEMADNVLILRENDVTLEFTSMNGSAVVKQADVVMVTYPLGYTANYTSENSLNDLDYYAAKQSPDGPAMTWAIFSVVANDVSPSGCSAYTYHQYSYRPYTRAPFFQLSEQMVDDTTINGGTHPAYPFLTGHGGANQVAIYGYLGLRLVPDDILHVDPSLPPQIPHLKYRTFFWRGWPISAVSNQTHTTISRAQGVPPLDTADKRFANKTITIHSGPEVKATTYRLPVKGSVVIPNRQIGDENTVAGNLVQCQPVSSTNLFEPGQFPISAVDGARSTKWQPSHADDVSSVTVSFEEEAGSLVSGFYFDWAQAPPVNATIVFHNKTLTDPAKALSAKSADYMVVHSLTNVNQSNPYDHETTNLDEIAIPIGNTTNVTLSSPVRAARYASLLIVGNQALDSVDVEFKNGTGATVAEWAILGQDQKNGTSSGTQSAKRKLDVRVAASDSFTQRRRQFLSQH